MVKVSIGVPVYNANEYLRECLDSILNQTFQDFEVLLVDDGSTDGSITSEFAAACRSTIRESSQRKP
ncbi:glycosyltransferase [Ligilactobacillus salivarius]|uniref:glycosyltransferase family 2 protein n=1 Tax=Ligilactobacillus salivarius TaxID=1624 RepID=UPI0026BD7700